MAADLASLNSQTAKICNYHVRILKPEIENYMWAPVGKAPKKMQNFRCYLVGTNPGDYLPGIVRGEAKAQAAFQKFKGQSVWNLTRCVVDTKTAPQWISGPIKYCINLSAPTSATALDAEQGKMLAEYMLPKYNVAACLA